MANEQDNRTRTKNSRSFELSEIKTIFIKFCAKLRVIMLEQNDTPPPKKNNHFDCDKPELN